MSSLIAGLNFQTTHELQTLTHDYLQLLTDIFSTKVFKAHDYLQLLTDTFSTKVFKAHDYLQLLTDTFSTKVS